MPVTNTSRSKKFLEKQGYSVWIVEQNMNVTRPGGKPMIFKRDVFNYGDILAFSVQLQAIALIQTTTTSNQAARVQKVISIPEAEGWLKSGGKIYIHGWKKSKKTQRWTVTVTAIELDHEFSGLRAREITLDDSPLFSSINHDKDESEEEDDLDSMALQKPA